MDSVKNIVASHKEPELGYMEFVLKTKGLLYKDFYLSGNMVLVLHRNYITCFNLLD